LAVLRPQEGGLRWGEKILALPYYSQRAVFASPLSAFFHCNYYYYYIITHQVQYIKEKHRQYKTAEQTEYMAYRNRNYVD